MYHLSLRERPTLAKDSRPAEFDEGLLKSKKTPGLDRSATPGDSKTRQSVGAGFVDRNRFPPPGVLDLLAARPILAGIERTQFDIVEVDTLDGFRA